MNRQDRLHDRILSALCTLTIDVESVVISPSVFGDFIVTVLIKGQRTLKQAYQIRLSSRYGKDELDYSIKDLCHTILNNLLKEVL